MGWCSLSSIMEFIREGKRKEVPLHFWYLYVVYYMVYHPILNPLWWRKSFYIDDSRNNSLSHCVFHILGVFYLDQDGSNLGWEQGFATMKTLLSARSLWNLGKIISEAELASRSCSLETYWLQWGFSKGKAGSHSVPSLFTAKPSWDCWQIISNNKSCFWEVCSFQL